jgi:periplasmic divalent cation tolerance protein
MAVSTVISGKIRAMPTEALVILCTCPDTPAAESLAHGLVSKRLAACVNVLPGIRSIYRWENELEDESEVLLLIKTASARLAELEAWLNKHHPYEVPELVAIPAQHVAPGYLSWLLDSVDGSP